MINKYTIQGSMHTTSEL